VRAFGETGRPGRELAAAARGVLLPWRWDVLPFTKAVKDSLLGSALGSGIAAKQLARFRGKVWGPDRMVGALCFS
jgi:hypothetical protein